MKLSFQPDFTAITYKSQACPLNPFCQVQVRARHVVRYDNERLLLRWPHNSTTRSHLLAVQHIVNFRP